jgi:hypothetical protein
MRTTLNLDDDVLRAIRSLARERGESLGAVASRLIREALRPPVRLEYTDDFPVFAVREGTPPLTPEMVRDAQEDP